MLDYFPSCPPPQYLLFMPLLYQAVLRVTFTLACVHGPFYLMEIFYSNSLPPSLFSFTLFPSQPQVTNGFAIVVVENYNLPCWVPGRHCSLGHVSCPQIPHYGSILGPPFHLGKQTWGVRVVHSLTRIC